MKVGDWVKFYRGDTVLTGRLERWEDDAHEHTFADGFATLRMANGEARRFRRSGGLGPNNWEAKAKSMRNVGYMKVAKL